MTQRNLVAVNLIVGLLFGGFIAWNLRLPSPMHELRDPIPTANKTVAIAKAPPSVPAKIPPPVIKASTPREEEEPPTPEIAVAADEDPQAGDTVVLRDGSNDYVMLAPTLVDYAEFRKLALARDSRGMALMVVSGSLYMLDNGVRARVIEEDYPSDCYRVRVLNGSQANLDGWAHFTVVHRN